MTDRGLFLGRFQPLHLGHLAVLTRLVEAHDEVVVGVGSANVSHTAINPFTAGERLEMLFAALDERGLTGRVRVVPIPDLGRNALWVSHVASLVPRFGTLYTNNPLPARLFQEAGHKVLPAPFVEREKYEGTRIRRLMIEDDATWKDLVPASVPRVLEACDGISRLRDLRVLDGVVEGRDPSV